MAWNFNNREPVFMQIANRLRADVVIGKYAADEQFPSVRQIACEAAVNPNTVQRALSALEGEGLLCSRGTVGRFVTSDTEIISAARERIRRDVVKSFLLEAKTLGINADELIKYIKEEEDNE